MNIRLVTVTVLLALTGASRCDSGGDVLDIRTPDVPEPINPADFVAVVDNPYWPLAPGTRWAYRVEEPDGTIVTDSVEVLGETRTVNGVQATVVWDRVFEDGELVEETWDWYAQHRNGDVWYLGEDTYEYEDGEVVCACGAWESGVNGALAGVYFRAAPAVGDFYYQEYYLGAAQDVAEVLALDQTVTVPAGTFEGCVKTAETTPLDPEALEHKYFCPGVGGVLTVNVADGDLREELIIWDHD